MDVCREYAPIVEKASIDECYLDLSGTHRIYPDPIVLAHTIKDKIRNEFGFTVNVGIGDNKLLAKMASDFEKPDKVHTLFDYEIEEKMWHLPVRELFSVGESTAQKLERSYIRTIGELARMDVAVVKSILGVKAGEHFDFIEIMACPGGCVNGGGQPYGGRDATKARSKGLYEADMLHSIRRSEENPVAHAIYEKFLCGRAHELLHVDYTKKNK